MWTPLYISFLLIFHVGATQKKRVCVIGTGLSGIAALKQLSDFVDDFEPIAFEKNSDVGGLWIYTNESDLDKHGLLVHSRVYKNLRTTVPKKIMTFRDYPRFDGRDNRSFVSHEMVLEYIRNYTDHFNLRRYIQFNTLVTRVTPIKGNGDWTTTKWRVETRNSDKDNRKTICDAIMVCNGHFYKPNVPSIPGIESFPGRVIHSSTYRTPESFANRTVVVLGASVSGQEISVDLSKYAKTVYLSHRHDKIEKDFPSNVLQVKGVLSVDGSRLNLQDNSTIIADDFLFCTGYRYDYPFLDESSGTVVKKNYVGPLYKLVVNVEHPSMGFIGVPNNIVALLVFYTQSKYYVSLLRGKAQLPSHEDMKNSAARSLELGSAQWDYYDGLARDADFESAPLFYQRGFNVTAGLSPRFLDYREFDFAVLSDDEVRLVRRRDGKTGSGWMDFVD